MTIEDKQLAKPDATIRDLLVKSKDQIRMALPKHMTPDRIVRIAMTACQMTPRLLDCHPITLIGAVIKACQLGLEAGGGAGESWLVPFRNNKKGRLEVQLIPDYRGLIKLVRRSGEIKPINAQVVHEKDKFEYCFGLNPKLVHIPSREKDPGKPTHFYTVAEFTTGQKQFEVMTMEEVLKIRSRSKARDAGPWVTDFEAMGKKTVLKRICKYLPSSSEIQQAIVLDDKAEIGIPQDLGTLADPAETGTPDIETTAEPIKNPKRPESAKTPENGAQAAQGVQQAQNGAKTPETKPEPPTNAPESSKSTETPQDAEIVHKGLIESVKSKANKPPFSIRLAGVNETFKTPLRAFAEIAKNAYNAKKQAVITVYPEEKNIDSFPQIKTIILGK